MLKLYIWCSLMLNSCYNYCMMNSEHSGIYEIEIEAPEVLKWGKIAKHHFWVLESAMHGCRSSLDFEHNLSFLTLFEARFKVLDSWRVTLLDNNALEIKHVHENMNDVFYLWKSYEMIIDQLYHDEFEGCYELAKSVKNYCDKILWGIQ